LSIEPAESATWAWDTSTDF